MSEDELSPEQEAELERFAQRVVDEAGRVGVDWEAATARMRALDETTWTETSPRGAFCPRGTGDR